MKNILVWLKLLWRDLFLNCICASILIPRHLRYFLYKIYGLDINTTQIFPRCFIGNSNISIGKNTYINYKCFFNTAGGINIGNNCNIAYKVTFCTSTHEIGDCKRRAGNPICKPIVIKNGCWIGANSIILPGVTIGEGCIIGAGSVVTKDCEPNGLYIGNPAKRIKTLD